MLLEQVERAEAPEAWDELRDRLCLHGETVSPASLRNAFRYTLARMPALREPRLRAVYDRAC